MRNKPRRREFKAEVTEAELKKIRRVKVEIEAENNKDLILKLIEHYLNTKGSRIL